MFFLKCVFPSNSFLFMSPFLNFKLFRGLSHWPHNSNMSHLLHLTFYLILCHSSNFTLADLTNEKPCVFRYHKNGQSLLLLLPSEEPEMLKVTQHHQFLNTAETCSLPTSKAAHQGGAYSAFCTMKWLGVFLLPSPTHPPPHWMGCFPLQGYLQH